MKIMNKNSVIFVIICLACKMQAYEGKVTVHAAAEDGSAIANATVVVQFENALKPGEGWGAGVPTEVRGITDTNGVCVLDGKGTSGSAGITVWKNDYYGASVEAAFTNADFVLNHWLPWNPIVQAVLKKKGAQVAMYAKKVREIKIPITEKPVGFDLMVGDWVGPYGKGITPDFLFKFESKPEPEVPPREPRPFDVTLTLSFPHDGDGIQSVFVPPRVSSELRLPRQAPLDGYEPILVKHQQNERGHVANIEFREDQNYFFRVRTKKDDRGNIVGALYGKISGDFNQEDGGYVVRGRLSFTYYLNPTPNDRNMEFDSKQNLFKNLPSLEQVNAP